MSIMLREKSVRIRDPWSAFTHFVGMIAAMVASGPLFMKASMTGDNLNFISMVIFMTSMILLYGASFSYHAFANTEKLNSILRRIDHMMIPVLIAGSYTPICLITLKGGEGYLLFTIVWSIALFSILLKIFFIKCPKWFSSALYIGMGWLCVMALGSIYANLSFAAFMWLLGGGILYTIGGVVYACKFTCFDKKNKDFGSHEIFHLFVMAGSTCHYILMYGYIC